MIAKEVYYATLDREGKYSPHYGVFGYTPAEINFEIQKVSKSGDIIRMYHGYFDLTGSFISESDEPYNEYTID